MTAQTKETALDSFVQKKLNIDHMLNRIQQASNEHFSAHPDAISWADVGSVAEVEAKLKQITGFLFQEGEYAE